MEKKIDIRSLVINPDNPRVMSEFMEGKLIESILVFPKMLDLRPLLINQDHVVIGGNQRLTVLLKILEMPETDIEDYMFNQKKYRLGEKAMQQALMEYWRAWKASPEVSVRVLDDIAADQQKEILVKDNLHYGEDDVNILKQFFDRESIGDYTGTMAWNLYDYNDKINDQELDLRSTYPEKFRCGFVECQMTDREFSDLCAFHDKYLAEHDGSGDGFLTALLYKQL